MPDQAKSVRTEAVARLDNRTFTRALSVTYIFSHVSNRDTRRHPLLQAQIVDEMSRFRNSGRARPRSEASSGFSVGARIPPSSPASNDILQSHASRQSFSNGRNAPTHWCSRHSTATEFDFLTFMPTMTALNKSKISYSYGRQRMTPTHTHGKICISLCVNQQCGRDRL